MSLTALVRLTVDPEAFAVVVALVFVTQAVALVVVVVALEPGAVELPTVLFQAAAQLGALPAAVA